MTTAISGDGVNAPTINQTVNPFKQQLQVARFITGALATGTTIMPADNTIPQSNEGDQYMQLIVTPRKIGSELRVRVNAYFACSTAQHTCVALFRDLVPDAIACGASTTSAAGYAEWVTFDTVIPITSLTPITLKVRIGAAAAGTTTFNGSGGVGWYGGTVASGIIAEEWA